MIGDILIENLMQRDGKIRELSARNTELENEVNALKCRLAESRGEVERLKRLIEVSHQNARMLVAGLDHVNEVRIGYLGAAPDQVIKIKPIESKLCQGCLGRGYIRWDDRPDTDCGQCNGTGRNAP
jgi:predicted RNase H-like nuclease (RuvC/YqgF family)